MDYGPKDWNDDPVAQKTAWSPEKRGGSSFRTHHLKSLGVTRMEFRMTRGAKMFCWFFIGMGICVPLVIVSQGIQEPGQKIGSVFFVALVGMIFVAAGAGILHFMGKPRVFDKSLAQALARFLSVPVWDAT